MKWVLCDLALFDLLLALNILDQAQKMILQHLILWLPWVFDVQGSAVLLCISEHAFQVIDSGWRGQLGVKFTVSLFTVVILVLLFTSLFMHLFIPMAYVITYTQMTHRSTIPVGVPRLCLCISLPASSP